LLRIGEWQRAQEQGVDNAEDGNVGADAKAQDKDGNEGESAVVAQGTEV